MFAGFCASAVASGTASGGSDPKAGSSRRPAACSAVSFAVRISRVRTLAPCGPTVQARIIPSPSNQ